MNISQKIKDGLTQLTLKQILLIAFALRISWYLLIFFTNPEGFWLYDSYGYWNIAYNVKEYGVFSQSESVPLLPDYFRTPLYPLLILPTIFFDSYGYSIPLLQIGLDIATCFLVYKIILLVSRKENYAKAGAILYAVHIPAMVMTNFVLSESTFAFLLTLFVLLVIKLISDFGFINAFKVGIVGGLCVMCKPLAFILLFPTLLFILIYKKINYQTIVAVLCIGATFYAVQLPWMQRNKHLYGRYFNSVLGEHLLLGYHASNIYAKANNISFNHAQEILRDAFIDKIDYDPYKHPYEYAKLVEQKFYEIFISHKLLFAKEHLKECIKFFIQPMRGYITSQLGKNHAYTMPLVYSLFIIQIVSSSFIYCIILLTLYLFIRKRIKFSFAVCFILALLLVFSQFNTMPYTDGRIRFPIDPILIVLSISCLDLINSIRIKKII